MAAILLAVFACSCLLSLWACRDVRRWTVRRGIVAMPRPDRSHRDAVPLGGGVALLMALVAAVVAGMFGLSGLVACTVPEWAPLGDSTRLRQLALELMREIPQRGPRLAVLLAGAAAITAVGYWDDRRRLSPPAKLFLQFAVAVPVSFGGVRLGLFLESVPGGEWIGVGLTAGWLVLCMNVWNFLDHHDGICAGSAAIVAGALLVIALRPVPEAQPLVAALLAAFAGALAGFLGFNFPPARLFLGDAGSLLIGYLLGVVTALFTFYTRETPVYAYATPVVLFAVPFGDTAIVLYRRWREGRPLMIGDTTHLAHRLMQRGRSPRGATLIVWGLTALTGAAGVLVYEATPAGVVAIGGLLIAVAAGMFFLARPDPRG